MTKKDRILAKLHAELRRSNKEDRLDRKDTGRGYADLTPYNAVQLIKENNNIILK